MKRSLVVVVLLLALALGFAGHGALHGRDSQKKREGGARVGMKSSGVRWDGLRAREIAALTKGMRKEGGREEWLRWLSSLEGARASELPRFFESAPDNSAALDILVERWVELDAGHCLGYLLRRFEEGEFGAGLLDKDRDFSAKLFRVWAEKDLAGARRALDGVEGFPYLYRLQKEVAQQIAKKDVVEALLYAKEKRLFMGPEGFHLYANLKKWIGKNPRAAGELLFGLQSGGYRSRDYGMRELAEVWGKKDARGAVEFGLESGGEAGMKLAEEVFANWVEKDFAGAADWLERVPTEKADFLTATLITGWSKKEPGAALDWSLRELEGQLLENAAKGAVIESAFVEGVDTGELLGRIESEELLGEVAVSLAEYLWGSSGRRDEMTKVDREEYLKQWSWFEGVRDGRDFHRLLRHVAFVDEEVREEMLELVFEDERLGMLRGEGHQQLLYGMLSVAPAKAMQLASEAPEGVRLDVMRESFGSWMERDLKGAGQWIEASVMSEQEKLVLVENFVTYTNFRDPERSLQKFEKLEGALKGLVNQKLLEMERWIDTAAANGEYGGPVPDMNPYLEATAE